jgi:hypothetical protein
MVTIHTNEEPKIMVELNMRMLSKAFGFSDIIILGLKRSDVPGGKAIGECITCCESVDIAEEILLYAYTQFKESAEELKAQENKDEK